MRALLVFASRWILAVGLALLPRGASAQPRPLPAHGGLPSRWPRAPQLDVARAAMGVDVAWERFGLAGRGATVCIVDTGIDLTHRDFLDQGGQTRVDWLLDLDGPPRGAFAELESRFGGAVLDGGAIDELLASDPAALPIDWHGHGTAMASAAVGDDGEEGVALPGVHAGVAPRARLVVVRALRRGVGGFADPDIVTGVAFCEAVADPGRTVVLLALGGHDGLHDGSEPIERELAAFVHRGLSIVVAAGNDSGRSFHAAARVPTDAVERLTVHVPSPEDPRDAHLALAIRGASSLVLVAPDGARTPPLVRDDVVTVRARSAVLALDATREGVVDVTISGDAETPLAGGDYVIELAGPARFDAWIVSESLGGGLGRSSLAGRSVVRGDEVTIPATTEPVVAVGSSVSTSFLPHPDGAPGLTLEADREGRAVFSAVGPSASGAARPDVLAPGGWIVAALSSGVRVGDGENLFRGDDVVLTRHRRGDDHVAVAGTSVSAALVAGVLALAFESAVSDPAADRSLLALTAAREGAPFTPRRGFGAVDVPTFLAARAAPALPIAALEGSATRPFVTPGATDLGLVIAATNLDVAAPADAWVDFLRDGEVVARAPLVRGIARARVPVGRAVVGDYVTFTATTSEASVAIEVPVVLDEDGSLADPHGGGSCTAMPGRTTDRGGLATLVLLAIALRRPPALSRGRGSRRT